MIINIFFSTSECLSPVTKRSSGNLSEVLSYKTFLLEDTGKRGNRTQASVVQEIDNAIH